MVMRYMYLTVRLIYLWCVHICEWDKQMTLVSYCDADKIALAS